MNKLIAILLLTTSLQARAADIIIGNFGSGGGSVVTNTVSVTNTVEVAPAWLATGQTLDAGDANTNLTLNITNGATAWIWCTNTLASNVTVELTLPTLSTNLQALALAVAASNTAIGSSVETTNDCSFQGTYTWNSENSRFEYAGFYITESGGAGSLYDASETLLYTISSMDGGTFGSGATNGTTRYHPPGNAGASSFDGDNIVTTGDLNSFFGGAGTWVPGDGAVAFTNSSYDSWFILASDGSIRNSGASGGFGEDIYWACDSYPVGNLTAAKYVKLFASYVSSGSGTNGAYAINWPANCKSDGGIYLPLTNSTSLATNWFNLQWRGDSYFVSPMHSPGAITNP